VSLEIWSCGKKKSEKQAATTFFSLIKKMNVCGEGKMKEAKRWREEMLKREMERDEETASFRDLIVDVRRYAFRKLFFAHRPREANEEEMLECLLEIRGARVG
jgi:hypothetical protein